MWYWHLRGRGPQHKCVYRAPGCDRLNPLSRLVLWTMVLECFDGSPRFHCIVLWNVGPISFLDKNASWFTGHSKEYRRHISHTSIPYIDSHWRIIPLFWVPNLLSMLLWSKFYGTPKPYFNFQISSNMRGRTVHVLGWTVGRHFDRDLFGQV